MPSPCCNDQRQPPEKPLLDVIRPNFFPGQSLTDKDLTALMDWALARWRLEAVCDDWGVACGMHVSIDPDNPGQLLVSHGYGFTATRQLCVVPECDGKRSDANRQVPGRRVPITNDVLNCMPSISDDELKKLAGAHSCEPSAIRIFDVKAAPHDCVESRAIALAVDGQRHCEVSRVQETAHVYCCACNSEPSESNTSAEPGVGEYFRRLLVKYSGLSGEDSTPAPDDAMHFAAWLRAFIDKHPGLKVNLTSEENVDEQKLTECLARMIFNLRRTTTCVSQSSEKSIPLARVGVECRNGTLKVLWIDEGSPYRKTLRCGPRGFRPREWIGEPLDVVQRAADAVGVKIEGKDWVAPKNLAALKEFYELEAPLLRGDGLYEHNPIHAITLAQSGRGDRPIVIGYSSKSSDSIGTDSQTATPKTPTSSEPAGATNRRTQSRRKKAVVSDSVAPPRENVPVQAPPANNP